MTPEKRGGWTRHQPSGDRMTIFEAHERYRAEGKALVVVAGGEYGTGSSRDWAARGPHLLGVRAIVAEGFERIHRSNLVGMGILPLQFQDGVTRKTLGLDGTDCRYQRVRSGPARWANGIGAIYETRRYFVRS